jgi:hypothetical protein
MFTGVQRRVVIRGECIPLLLWCCRVHGDTGLDKLYSSPYMIRVRTLSREILAGHVARTVEMRKLAHFVDNRLTDGDEVSLTLRPPFTPRKIPGTHFC